MTAPESDVSPLGSQSQEAGPGSLAAAGAGPTPVSSRPVTLAPVTPGTSAPATSAPTPSALTTASGQPALAVAGLVKRYGQLVAVNNVSFSVWPGETFGLLGPNGAGKTTTLEIIEGLRRPDGGQVMLEGIDALARSRLARSLIGVQLQEAGFFEKLTVAETIQTFARFHRRSLPLPWLLERLQLQEKAHTLVENLSGGQRQRLSIALALVNDPQVVFLDEPTTGLDPQARRNLWDTIREIRADGRTIILTTHYMDEAQELCDRVAILDQGRIIALDTPVNLIQRYVPGVKVYVTPVREDDRAQLAEQLAQLPETDGQVGANGHVQGGAGPVEEALRNQSEDGNGHGNGELWVRTQNLEATIGALIELAKSGQIRYRSLRVEASNLEDVFLTLTGRRLRD